MKPVQFAIIKNVPQMIGQKYHWNWSNGLHFTAPVNLQMSSMCNLHAYMNQRATKSLKIKY